MNQSPSEEAIFCDALELPFDQRADFLIKACAGDDQLLMAVKELMRLHNTDEEFLATPAIGLSPNQVYEQPGDRVGSYLLEATIGEGGFGVVWQAQQLAPIQRKVALKIVKLGMDSEVIVKRFDEERQTLALMNHPNIATVLDAGVTDSGRPFFAMELVDGESIDKFCQDRNLSIGQLLEVFIDVCRGVQHAHQKGIVHRDLKPSNILVSCDDLIVAKVIDFGIATAIQTKDQIGQTTTGHAALIGTPKYMSPEQWRNEVDIDTRSDIFSLGVVLYRLLSGTEPEADYLTGKQHLVPPSRRRAMIVEDVINDKKPMSRPTIQADQDLDCIVCKAMSYDRDDRYQSVSELAVDIESYLNGQLVLAHPGGTFYQMKKFVRRNKIAVGFGTMTLLALLVAVCASTWGFLHANEQRQIADDQKLVAQQKEIDAVRLKEIAEAEATKLRVVANVLKNILPEANPYRGLKSGFQIRENLEQLINSVDALSSEPELEAELRVSVARIYENLSRFGRARLQYSLARKIRIEIYGETHPKTMLCANGMATCNISLGKFGRAEALIQTTLANSKDRAPRVHISSLRTLRKIRHEQQRFVEAFEIAEQCLALSEVVYSKDIFGRIGTVNEYSIAARKIGLARDAEQALRNALNLLERDHPTRKFVVANTKHRLAEILIDLEQYDEAQMLVQSFVQMQTETLGENDEYVIGGLALLSEVHRLMDQLQSAEQIARDAISRARKLPHEQIKIRATAFRQLAIVLTASDLPRALTAWEDAIKYRRQHYGSHVLVAKDMLNQATVLSRLRQFEEAAECVRQSIEILQVRQAANAILAPAYLQYSEILIQLGDEEQAEEFANKSKLISKNN